ncbi:MAG: hypothetical protein ACXIUL_03715 [Wenzhouxiangella sp.]
MSNLSFQEKSTWGTLFALLVIGTLYSRAAWQLWQHEALVSEAVFGLLLGYTVLLVVVLVGYHVLISVLSSREDDDERDRLIEWRSGNIGGLVLGFGVFTVIGHILVGGWRGDPLFLSPVAIANVLLLVMLVASVAEMTLKLYYYRRGI